MTMRIYLITTVIICLLLEQVHVNNCLRLTNMSAPALQDPRHNMHLHCRFDMGGEDLYAVKWYKDDHEFFRYSPTGDKMLRFSVPGVFVDAHQSKCNDNRCDLLLTSIKKPSSGAYRCEVSTEAPAFRLASQTHNVTVAAMPENPPLIEGLANSYNIGDILTATCTSDLGDPKPSLAFYINNKRAPKEFVRILNTNTTKMGEFNLRNNKIQLRIKLMKNFGFLPHTEIACISTLDGVGSHVPITALPSLKTTHNISIIDPNQTVNNQKFWADPSTSFTSDATQILKNYNEVLLIFVISLKIINNYLFWL